jgi:predicted HicB family RNase H-like nuclease
MVDVISGTFYSYKGYEGVYKFSKEDNDYCGKISNTDDLVLFEGNDLSELYQSFKNAVDDYIEFKKEVGKN